MTPEPKSTGSIQLKRVPGNRRDFPDRLCQFYKIGLIMFLVSVTSPTMAHSLPEAPVNHYAGDTLEFSGYRWVVKESNNRHTGPGKNYFSGSRDNVWIDEEGRLHLRITYRNDRWYCAEVRMINSLGYGKYTFYIERFPQPLDKDAVMGLFMYNHEDTTNYHNEIDIEFSKWGKDAEVNSQYVVQPYEDKANRFQTDLQRGTKHEIQVRKRKIYFKSQYHSGINPDSISSTFAEWKYKLDQTYKTSNEKVSINLWLYKATEPSNLKELEVIVSRFEFSPYKLEKLNPAIPKLNRLFKKNKAPKSRP